MKSLQKFGLDYTTLHSHFNLERHVVDRKTYRERRSTKVAEWRQIAA